MMLVLSMESFNPLVMHLVDSVKSLENLHGHLGAEYTYQENFAFRAGYFNEAEDKGARKFFARSWI